MSSPLANTVSAIRVGDIQCFPIADGDHLYPRSALYGDDPERTIGVPEQIAVPYTPLLVDTDSHRILIDTGAGPLALSSGHLEASLSRAGFQASDIDMVLLSHAHPDHIGGLVRGDGTLKFPNARVLISQREYDFWHSAELRSQLGTGSVYGSPELENLMGVWIDRYLPPVRDRLEWLVAESEIAPGIVAIDAPGHTPGHLGFAISSGSESRVYGGGLLLMWNKVVHTDWTTMLDMVAQKII
jgi:glyoxylase-like metal-dependent hydrolase (beta-lactamase superfamily II)